MRLKLSFFSFFLFFYACKSKCDCYAELNKHYKDTSVIKPWNLIEIETDPLKYIAKKNKQYRQPFDYHFFNKKGTNYFVSFSPTGQTIIYNFDNNKLIAEIDGKDRFPLKTLYTALFVNDTLHYVNSYVGKYYSYKINDDWSLTNLDSINIAKELDCSNCVIYSNISLQNPAYKYPFLLLHYGHKKAKNFIDHKAYLKVNIEKKSVEKTGDFPDCFRCSFIYDATSSAIFTDKFSVVSLFNQYDELFVFEPEGIKRKTFNINHQCEFKTFDESKEQNLAYVRKYLENSEKNIRLLNISNKYYVVLKRLAKTSLNESNKYSLLVFDAAFKQIYTEVVQHPVYTYAIFEYKKGFIMFTDSLDKAYYYEFKE